MAEADARAAKRRLAEVTGLANPNSVGQLLGWLQGRGCAIENCARATLEAELARPDLDADAREAIELRLSEEVHRGPRRARDGRPPARIVHVLRRGHGPVVSHGRPRSPDLQRLGSS